MKQNLSFYYSIRSLGKIHFARMDFCFPSYTLGDQDYRDEIKKLWSRIEKTVYEIDAN